MHLIAYSSGLLFLKISNFWFQDFNNLFPDYCKCAKGKKYKRKKNFNSS